MSRMFRAIAGMVLLTTVADNAVAANAPAAAAATPADALRGGWVTDIDGVRHIFILKVHDDGAVTGIYCDVDCSDPAHLSLIERGALTRDGVRFQIRRLDGKAPERTDVTGRITDNHLVLTAGARRWTLE